jgi:hypothetical protein
MLVHASHQTQPTNHHQSWTWPHCNQACGTLQTPPPFDTLLARTQESELALSSVDGCGYHSFDHVHFTVTYGHMRIALVTCGDNSWTVRL